MRKKNAEQLKRKSKSSDVMRRSQWKCEWLKQKGDERLDRGREKKGVTICYDEINCSCLLIMM